MNFAQILYDQARTSYYHHGMNNHYHQGSKIVWHSLSTAIGNLAQPSADLHHKAKTLKHQNHTKPHSPLAVHITFPSDHHLLGKSDHSTTPKSCHSMITLHSLHVKSPHSNFELLIPHCPYQSYYQSPPFPQPLGCVFPTFLSNTHSIFRNQPTLQLIPLILLRNHPIFTAKRLCPL